MRLTEGSTSTTAVVAIFLSVVAIVLSLWTIYLEPSRIEAQIKLTKANEQTALAVSDLAAKVGTIIEYIGHEDKLEELERVTNESNRQMQELRNAKRTDAR